MSKKQDLTWSVRAAPSADPLVSKPPARELRESLPTTGGLYDLDTLDEDLVHPSGPSSSAFASEPKLDKLRAINKNKASFKDIMRAADADAQAHTARMREGGVTVSNKSSQSEYSARVERAKRWDEKAAQLKKESGAILRAFDKPLHDKGETAAEVAKERMARWQKALELYVYCPEESGVDLLKLLEKLIEGCGEEEELLDALSAATQTCTSLSDQTTTAVRDATSSMSESEETYHIRLEAHTLLANRAADQSEKIEEQFRTNGKSALRIGQQLEAAEAKKRQCDTASLLIRQWWMMENLAEQEELSGETLQVEEEIRGLIPSSSCRMDPLFTRSENSLEAARALKALRTVVKSRGSSASGGLLDPISRHRFDVTSRLIQRTSAALENRLIQSFSEIYVKGGTYDFSSPDAASRPGKLNWIELRNLAMALALFDGGRGLHKRYVQMVVTSRFPEFFQKESRHDADEHNENSDEEEEDDVNVESMRQKMILFHRVCEVCTAEFQLIANVFSSPPNSGDAMYDVSSLSDAIPFQVARALLQRVISDPRNGLQARINDLLDSIDRRGDFEAGSKKLDTFVVIHEKAAGLFTMLKESAQSMLLTASKGGGGERSEENARAVASLIQFLTTQEMSLSSSHRHGYLNLELRLLHHECCSCLDRSGAKLVMPKSGGKSTSRHNPPIGKTPDIATYEAPLMPLDKQYLKRIGFAGLLNGPLKQSVLRQPLMHATDSLARARLMFGVGHGGVGDVDTARVITGIFAQMCTFYGQSFLFPIVEVLGDLLDTTPPSAPPNLPFDENSPAPDLGVDGSFWVGIERIHSAAKSFDRELWAEQRVGSERVWEILSATGSHTSMALAKDHRADFFQELEERGEIAILRALDTLSTHIQWVLVSGGENMIASAGSRLLNKDRSQGPYAVPSGSALDTANSPAVKSLTFCLRAQFVHIQAALTPQSLSAFWTALSMRLYDVVVARLLQHYYVSMVGAVNLSRDVEALRSVAMLAGTDHQHWDLLRELLTLYMTPPAAIKTILVGPEGDPNAGKGLFGQAGKDQSLVFMSRRVDYRVRINQTYQKAPWAMDLFDELGLPDPAEGNSVYVIMMVSFAFEAIAGIAPLTATLPQNTSIYHQWPPKSLRFALPKYHRVAVAVPDQSLDNFTTLKYDHVFMSPPIHVRSGDFLTVSVKNSLQATGLSLHWHGFEMTGHLEFDGVVGITQCPISGGDSFTYAWEVRESPGTYWYHTHSGELGIDAFNCIMAPLIVHPKEDSTFISDVPFLDSSIYDNDPYAQQRMSMDELLFYGNERILFFADGSLHSGAIKNTEMAGGLNPPISYNDDSFSVGTYPWNFGTTNGQLREIVPVSPGQTYKFRILNAGSMYALRISFDDLKMTIVAADSEPVEPVVVDEIILHAAERFDVEVTIPEDAKIGSTSWIRADTLESRKQGYQNGIRAIMHVVDANNSDPIDSSSVPDPDAPIETAVDHKTRLTYNCYSFVETEEKSGQGGCIPVSALHLKDGGTSHSAKVAAEAALAPFESHVIDWQFSASPQFVHFVRIDDGKWNQHVMHQGHSMLLPEYDAETMLHSNGAVLNVEAGVRAILIWRNKSTMDHPMHLHGRKMEILDQLTVKKSENCDHVKCRLSDAFTSNEEMERLASIPVGTRPLKDTFVLPAGGVVATRIYTGDPALWLIHCHLESHREDGMALILNVGNYQAPSDGSWLPPDYPKCDSSFLSTLKEFPACECYINEDDVMDSALTAEHRCSRDYLCFHDNSPQSNIVVHPYESKGIAIRSRYSVPGWVISLFIVFVIAISSYVLAYRKKLVSLYKGNQGARKGEARLQPNHADVKTEHVDVRPSGIAVLLINVQNEFVNEKGKLHHMVKEGNEDNNAIEKITELVSTARASGALVVHLTTGLEYGGLISDEIKNYYSCSDIFQVGTWNAGIPPELYLEGDEVFTTQSASAFSPELLGYLEENSIIKILLCGYTMDYAVRETLLSLRQKVDDETEILIVEDCCVASTIEKRQKNLYHRQRSPLLSAKNVDQNKAKRIITSSHATAAVDTGVLVMPRNNKRDTIRLSVERELPLTMDLPSQTTCRTTFAGPRTTFMGGTSQVVLPIAQKEFTVPKRRTEINLQIEGFKISGNVNIQTDDTGVNELSPFGEQFLHLFCSQWILYRPTCISLLRCTEVSSLAFFTGALFYSIGEDPTATGFGSINSLLFFSVTLWTFTRMYPAITTHFTWNESLRIIANEHRYSIAPVCLARCCVVFLCEFWWPFLYVFVCYPLASMAGSWNAMFRIGFLLALNNMCYISIGSALGVVVDKVPKGMIISTIMAQSSLIAAGFYTAVPEILRYLRYLSPVFWAYRGIVKAAFRWSDTFKCRWGSTLAGVNSCFIEFHTSIDNLKNRGIPVATFGDDHSTHIWPECLVLILFYVAMQTFLLCINMVRQYREDQWEVFFERLAEYKAIHGDINVPFDHKVEGIRLGWWTKLQRKQLKAGKLTDEQVERLEELGFGLQGNVDSIR